MRKREAQCAHSFGGESSGAPAYRFSSAREGEGKEGVLERKERRSGWCPGVWNELWRC